MSLQKTILNVIKRHGQPATVTWQASTDLALKAPKKGVVTTAAYLSTKHGITQTGQIAAQQVVYLPILERSIIGAQIDIGGRKLKVTAVREFVAGNRGQLMQEATVV